jgi:hypothetical protein
MTPAGNKELHTFKIDPTKATYVVPEGGKLGFVFKPEEQANDPAPIPVR